MQPAARRSPRSAARSWRSNSGAAARHNPQSPDGRPHSPMPAYDVYDGRYISSDPDPFIRNDLLRDPPNRE